MKIYLVRTRNFLQAELQKVYELLYENSGPLKFELGKKTFSFDDNNFQWEDFFGNLAEYRLQNQISKEDFIVVITNNKNNANWFSAFDFKGTKSIFIDGNDWENYIYADQAYPIAYEVIANILHYYLYRNDENLAFVHHESLGCISDFCGYKSQISLKLRTADICADCQTILLESLPNKEILLQCIMIIENLRKGMVYTKIFQKQTEFEEGLPFPIAHSKRKLSMTQQPYQKLQLLIEHYDSIVRTSVIIFSNLFLNDNEREEMSKVCALGGHPSLGSWVTAFKYILSNANIPIEYDFQRDILKKLEHVYKSIEFHKIVNLRNDLAHSYTDVRGPHYIKEFEEKSNVLNEIETILNPIFKRLNYFQVTNTKFLDDNSFELQVINFSGSNPAFLEEAINVTFNNLEDIPKNEKIYVVSNDVKKWTSVNPYWIFNICPSCDHQRLLIADGAQYIDPVVGHRVNC